MTTSVDIGTDAGGAPVSIDLEELLATRLLVQGNSGSGKSHLLRRLLERSAGQVQQVIVDPEGDFTTFAEPYGHVVIDAHDHSEREMTRFARRIREHRASVVLNLEGLEVEGQMRTAAAFLQALFEAPREIWYPALVVVDEAQLFAPSAAGEVNEEVRRASLSAMTNLMCRGRKRGLAGVIATQRLAKLAKNVAAEASNFLMGRTFLDIDMARAADLLGMERRQAEQIRDLPRGKFLGLGPAIARRPVAVTIGAVETAARGGGPVLTPPPAPATADLHDLLFAAEPVAECPASPPPPPRDAEAVLAGIVPPPAPPPAPDALPLLDLVAAADIEAEALAAIADDPDAAMRPPAVLFQDFQVRCRMAGLARPTLDLPAFVRRLGCARAGIPRPDEGGWEEALALAAALPDDMIGAFLLIARAAREERPCPDDAAIARTYGTSSLGRVRRLIAYIEGRDLIVCRTDLAGRRSITIPRLGWTTQPMEVV
ncbi:MAG: ATP-binding protein [Sphingomonas fennica]